jgi:hypothetical protein
MTDHQSPIRLHRGWMYDLPGCTSSCDQGRKPCPCPSACLRPEPDTGTHSEATFSAIEAVLSVVLLLIVAGLSAYVLSVVLL